MEEADPGGSVRHISVLLLAVRWQFDAYGISTITKSLVNNLRLVDPDAEFIKITCAVLDEEGKIGEVHLRDAEKYGVQLRGEKQPRGKKKKPELSWLNEQAVLYYEHTVFETKFDFIVGHVPYLADGCLNLKDHIKMHEGQSPKVIIIAHALPMTEEGNVDEECLTVWLREADFVLSVGDGLWEKIESFKTSMGITSVSNKLYLPGFPLDFFEVGGRKNIKELKGEQNLLVMATESENPEVSGLDFELAIASWAKVSHNIMCYQGSDLTRHISFSLNLVAARKDEKSKWEEHFKKIKAKHQVEGKSPAFSFQSPEDIERLLPAIRRATLFILPLKANYCTFGTEALVAMAAGVPILVSRTSGVASFLQGKDQPEPIVWDNKEFNADVETWEERLTRMIINPQEAQYTASELRKMLLLDTSIARTHLDYIQHITESMCIELVIDLAIEPVSREHVDAAIRFGVDLGNPRDPVDVKQYVIAYFKHLVCHREKLEKALLADHVQPAILKMWQDVLFTLEAKQRKLLDAKSGSVGLVLFCPNEESSSELRDKSWKESVRKQLEDLLRRMGVEAQASLTVPECPEKKRVDVTKKFRKLKFRDANSDKKSEGYETIGSSDIVSEKFSGDQKVENWLALIQQVADDQLGEAVNEEPSLSLVEAWTLEHVQNANCNNHFAISESGAIATASEPSLSVMYPTTKRPPVILSADKVYYSVTFLIIMGKEYVVATNYTNNNRVVGCGEVQLKGCVQTGIGETKTDAYLHDR